MSASQVIQAALSAGVHIATDGQQIIITAKEKPADTLLADLQHHKAEIITELEHLQRLWLARVASLLQSTPEHLLQSGLIDDVDLLEQWRTEPRHAAALIRSCWMPDHYQASPTPKQTPVIHARPISQHHT